MGSFQNLSKWRQTLVVGLVFVFLSVLLGLIAEGAVRIRHYLKYGDLWGVEDTYMVDAESGLRIPIPSTEQGGIRINSLGFRSPELAVPKPDGTVRLAFLGASTTYSAEVSSNEATWPHLVVGRFKQQWPEARFDYINAAVPGYGVMHSLQNLQTRVAPLDPDAIVIYHATNDLTSNSFDLAMQQGLVAKRTAQQLSWPTRYSLLWYLVEKNLRVLSQQAQAQSTDHKLDVARERLAEPFESDLRRLGLASTQVVSFIAVATFSHHLRSEQSEAVQAKAAVTNLYYMPYMSVPSILEGYAAYNDAIRRVAGELELHLIDGEFEIPGDGVHFVDSVHFTDAGSEAMASRVTDSLLGSSSFTQLVQRRINAQ